MTFSNVDKKSVEGELPIRLCNYTDVYYNDQITSDLPFMDATASVDQVRSFSLRAGDVLITKDSETADDIGVAAFVPETLDGVVCGYHLAILRPKRDRVDPKYLFWSMASSYARDQMSVLASGVTRYGLRFGDVENLRLYVPEPEEQRAVVRFIDRKIARIDQLVSRHRVVQELLEERLWSNAAFRVVGRRPDGGGEWTPGSFPPHWKAAPLARFAISITDGPFGSSLKTSHYASAGARVIRLGNIGRAWFKDEDHAFIPRDHYETLLQFDVRPGDLVVAGLGDRANPLARACVLPRGLGPSIVKADCFRIRLDERVLLHDYVAWFLSSRVGAQLAEAHSRGVTRPRINTQVAAALPIPVPPVGEQRQIISELESFRGHVCTAKAAINAEVGLLEEHRQALITAAVTGQIDVSTAAA